MLAAEKISTATDGTATGGTNASTAAGPTDGKHAVDAAIATQPADLASVPSLARAIAAGADAVTGEDDASRYELLLKARSLVQALETPRETMIKHCWAQTSATGALTFGVDAGLWELMARNGDAPQAVADLAAVLGVDPPLLARVMRHVAAMGYLEEVGVDRYRPTAFVKALTIPMIGAGYLVAPSASGAAQLRFHDYARKHGFRNPDDPADTSCNNAYKTKSNYFEYQAELGCESCPVILHTFCLDSKMKHSDANKQTACISTTTWPATARAASPGCTPASTPCRTGSWRASTPRRRSWWTLAAAWATTCSSSTATTRWHPGS